MLRAYLDEKGFKTAMIDDNLAMLFRKSVAGVRAKAPEMTAESQRKESTRVAEPRVTGKCRAPYSRLFPGGGEQRKSFG